MLREFARRTRAVVGVHSMPVIPLITDSTENLTGLIEATREIGADYWLPGTLNLRGLTRGMFFDCVRQNFPDAEPGLARLYASGHLDREYRRMLYEKIRALTAFYGVSTDYHRKLREWEEQTRGTQLSLF